MMIMESSQPYGPDKNQNDEERFALARLKMIEEIRSMALETSDSGARPISGKVLAVMSKVPRHRFVPEGEIFSAYYNQPLPIDTALPALTIAALYKSRWQVELFFKWIKQHLRIKRFIGNSENAVKTQIWCAVSTYVLIAIVKKELQLDASLYSLLQILSVSVFEKTQLSQAFSGNGQFQDQTDLSNQLNLFDF